MEIRQLKYFLSAIRHRSLRAAAAEHFVTQPAISIQLKRLEKELGEKLYYRAGREIAPTQAGELLVPQVEDILRRVDGVRESVQGLLPLGRRCCRLGPPIV